MTLLNFHQWFLFGVAGFGWAVYVDFQMPVQFHSEHLSSCCLVIVEQWYALILLIKCMITLTRMQGTRWQHRLLCIGRIPRQPPTSFPFHGDWFFRWRVRLGMFERYLGTKVCIYTPH